MEKYTIDLRDCKRWEDLPDPWTYIKSVPKRKMELGLKDQELAKLTEPYMSTDYLRPQMTGLIVEGNMLAATDAHRILTLPNTDGIPDGNYIITKVGAKINGQMYGQIQERSPNVRVVIPEKMAYTLEVDMLKLKTYLEAAIRGRYCNENFAQGRFLMKDNEVIGFNLNFLIDVCNTYLSLGYRNIHIGFQSISRGLVFAVKQECAKNPQEHLGKCVIALLMPVVVSQGQADLGCADFDFRTYLRCYFSFASNEIINHDGEKAKFDDRQDSKELPYITEDKIAVVKKILPKKPIIPIIGQVGISAGQLIATDLDTTIRLHHTPIVDGVYDLVSGALKDTNEKIDNYPTQKGKETGKPTELLKTGAGYYKKLLENLLPFVSYDDLRPAMMGAIMVVNDGWLWAAATNAHILIMRKFQKDNRKIAVTLKNVPKQIAALDLMESNQATISILDYEEKNRGGSDKFTIIDGSGAVELSSKYELNPPRIFSIIPKSGLKYVLSFDKVQMLNILNNKAFAAKEFVYLEVLESMERPESGMMSVNISNDEKDAYITVGSLNYTIAEDEDFYPDNLDNLVLISTSNINTQITDNQVSFMSDSLKEFVSVCDDKVQMHYKDKKSLMIAEIPALAMEDARPIAKVSKVKAKPIEQPKKANVNKVVSKVLISEQIEALRLSLEFLSGNDAENAQSQIDALETALEFVD